MELTNVVTQLWSQGQLLNEQMLWKDVNWAHLPKMHVAILSMATKKLVLIKVTSEPESHRDVSGQHTVVLDKVELYELSIENGIPMYIPEPANRYKEYKEARLHFGGPHTDDNAQSFQNELNELETDWQKLRLMWARDDAE